MTKPTHFLIRNWRDFQHYKDRNPPWIKLHFALLSSEDWVVLDDASRVLAIACMLIGSKDDGRVPNKPEYIKRAAYLNSLPDFQPLLDCGFLLADASALQADASTPQANARPEQSREEERRDIDREEKDSCVEPQSEPCASTLDDPTVAEFPVSGKPNIWQLKKSKMHEWVKVYGEQCDVRSELIKAKQWLIDNPVRRKTGRGMTKFLNGWLQRAINNNRAALPPGVTRPETPEDVQRRLGLRA